MDEWQEISGKLIVWDEPKEVIGVYQGYTEEDGKFGKQERHKLALDDGTVASFFAPSALSRLLEGVMTGRQIRIAYPGTTGISKTGQKFKEFRLYVKAAPVVEDDEVPF